MTPFLQLKNFPDIPVYKREEHRDPAISQEEPRSPSSARDEGSFPCFVGKEFSAFPSHLKRRRSQQERGEELQGTATIATTPRCLSPVQRNLFSLHCLDFHAEDGITPRWHVGHACGNASRESHRSLDQCDGKHDNAARSREESRRACPHSGRGLTPLWRFQKYPKIHLTTGKELSGPDPYPHKVLCPGIYWRAIPSGPLVTRMKTGLPEVTRAGL